MTREPIQPTVPLLAGGKYVPAAQTDIRKLFAQVREQQAAQQRKEN